jgi:hypothetical protein
MEEVILEKLSTISDDVKEIKAAVKDQGGRIVNAELEIDRLKRDVSLSNKIQMAYTTLTAAIAAWLGSRV